MHVGDRAARGRRAAAVAGSGGFSVNTAPDTCKRARGGIVGGGGRCEKPPLWLVCAPGADGASLRRRRSSSGQDRSGRMPLSSAAPGESLGNASSRGSAQLLWWDDRGTAGSLGIGPRCRPHGATTSGARPDGSPAGARPLLRDGWGRGRAQASRPCGATRPSRLRALGSPRRTGRRRSRAAERFCEIVLETVANATTDTEWLGTRFAPGAWLRPYWPPRGKAWLANAGVVASSIVLTCYIARPTVQRVLARACCRGEFARAGLFSWERGCSSTRLARDPCPRLARRHQGRRSPNSDLLFLRLGRVGPRCSGRYSIRHRPPSYSFGILGYRSRLGVYMEVGRKCSG